MLYPSSIKCSWKGRTSPAVAASAERHRNAATFTAAALCFPILLFSHVNTVVPSA